MHLFDEGYIRAAEKHNDASFDSFFKEGWKRFYLKWYGEPLPSAHALCPHTVALLEKIPPVKAAMFALLPPGSKLNPHRDPFAGSLRYHLGLITPNSDACRIFVDGEAYSWRDGEDVLFDETFVHWAENRTEQTRVILFCDVERPLRTPVMRAVNRVVSGILGRATASQNVATEQVGAVNRLYALAHRIGEQRKRFKRRLAAWLPGHARRPRPRAGRLAAAAATARELVRESEAKEGKHEAHAGSERLPSRAKAIETRCTRRRTLNIFSDQGGSSAVKAPLFPGEGLG